MQAHKSNIFSIKAIQEHILVPGDSHSGLWLGTSLLFKPGTPLDSLNMFFSVSDRTGGDSIQDNICFTASRPPENGDEFSTWHKSWKRGDYPESLHARTDTQGFRFVPTFNWKFHPASGKVIAFGHVLRHQGEKLSNHQEHCAISYSVYDPAKSLFSPWKSFRIKIDGQERPSVASGQRVDLPNGDILLPFSIIKQLQGWNSNKCCGSARCRFDGENIKVIETGNLLTHSVPRGFLEPSMVEYNNAFYMTLRAQDGSTYMTSSKDGLMWEEPCPLCWGNGDVIAMDQTMTKFVSRPEGLFLVYTRITENNTKVFRHRSPVFIAQIDSVILRLIRNSESIALGNNGFPLGNFNISEVSSRETWITSPEWDRSGENISCDNLLARIIWK